MSDRTIFKALNAVQSELAALGIGKNQTNNFDKYKYRGIDDVLNSLAPILSKNGVLIFPSVKEKEIVTVTTAKGGSMNHATLCVDYTLYDSAGDSVTHTSYGEAMDRGDKAINKAMTAAYKYFLFQAFCIPLVGSDADSESHEMTATPVITKAQAKQLRDAIKVAGLDEVALCQKIRIPTLDNLEAHRFDGAMNHIRSTMENAA